MFMIVLLTLATAIAVQACSFAFLPHEFVPPWRWSGFLLTGVLAGASVLGIFRPVLGYWLGLLAALCSLVWLVWIEGFRPAGSWQLFNYIGTGVSAWIKPLPMLSLALMIATIAGSALKLRGRPTWIALPSGILAVLAWYLACAHPYDDPMIVERSPAVRILHLEKQGLRIRETTVTIGGHGEAWIRKSERRLFQYRWELRWSRISPVGAAPAIEIVSKLKALREPPPVPSEWTADEWYLASDNRLYLLPEAPPAVHRIIDKAGVLEQKGEARDICLGFCYEPLVTLGYGSRQDRARFFATVP